MITNNVDSGKKNTQSKLNTRRLEMAKRRIRLIATALLAISITLNRWTYHFHKEFCQRRLMSGWF